MLAKERTLPSSRQLRSRSSRQSCQRLPLRLVMTERSPSGLISGTLMEVVSVPLTARKEESILFLRQCSSTKLPAGSCPTALTRRTVWPRRVRIVASLIASPPTVIAIRSTGLDARSKTSLPTG